MFISSRRRIVNLLLIFSDIIVLTIAIYLSTMIRFGVIESFEYILLKILPLIINISVFIVLFYIGGLYEVSRLKSYGGVIVTVFLSVFVGMLLSSFTFYADLTLKIGRGVFVLNTLFIFLLVLLVRVLFVAIIKNKIISSKVIIVGEDKEVQEVVKLIKEHATSSYQIQGAVNLNEEAASNTYIDGYKVLAPIDQITRVIKKLKTDVVVVTTIEPMRHKVLENLRVCRYRGVEIIDVVSLYEELEGRVPLKYIDDEWLFSSAGRYHGFHVKKVKRLMDIIFSIIGLILTLPFFIIVPVLIKLDSKGPVFYLQKRMGRFGKLFRVIKFRSMIYRAERGLGGPVWSNKNDLRITRVGVFLRKLRIDEIPQLINVLVGNMSLVGPRPERPAFVRDLEKNIPFYLERLYVQPGLTGWAQINYAYASNIEETQKKLEYDLYYIKNISFFLDVYILLKTLKIVFLGKGR